MHDTPARTEEQQTLYDELSERYANERETAATLRMRADAADRRAHALKATMDAMEKAP